VSPFYSALAVGLISLVAAVMLPAFIDRVRDLELRVYLLSYLFQVGRKTLLLCGSGVCMTSASLAATLLVVFGSTPESDVVSAVIVIIICIYGFTNSFTWLYV
jgi:hypothetical protein